MALYGLVAGALLLLMYRATRLNGIPDIGDPFDVAAFETRPGSSPELENLYRQAWAKLHPRLGVARELHWRRWATVDATTRAWLDRNREPLALWRRVADRPEPMHVFGMGSDEFQFPALALVEGARLEHEGRLAEAWEWYRALLRHSRQVERHGTLQDRLRGIMFLRCANSAIRGWSADPYLSGTELRRALKEVRAIDALTPPFSEQLKAQYLHELRDLEQANTSLLRRLSRERGEPAWYHEMPAFHWLRWEAGNEWERHRRILRMLFANWLAEADKPQADRPAPSTASRIFDDPDAPPAARALPPEQLNALLQKSAYESLANWLLPHIDGQIEGERIARAELVYNLAEQAYLREHGHFPATPQKLVGDLLPALADDFDPFASSPGPNVIPSPGVPSPNDPWLEEALPLFQRLIGK